MYNTVLTSSNSPIWIVITVCLVPLELPNVFAYRKYTHQELSKSIGNISHKNRKKKQNKNFEIGNSDFPNTNELESKIKFELKKLIRVMEDF